MFGDVYNFDSEYEMKLINNIIQPGGAGTKPQKELLDHFSKCAQTLRLNVIGSGLLYKL